MAKKEIVSEFIHEICKSVTLVTDLFLGIRYDVITEKKTSQK